MSRAIAFVSAAVLASLFSAPALAVEASYTATSASSPDAVWAKVGDFCGVANWGLGLKCALSADGKTRTLTTQDGGVVIEHLESRDDAGRTYSYTILTPGPLPVANYHSTIAVVPAGAGSSISWSGKFDAKGASDADAKKLLEGSIKPAPTIWRNRSAPPRGPVERQALAVACAGAEHIVKARASLLKRKGAPGKASERNEKGKSFHFLSRIETFQRVTLTPRRFFLFLLRPRTKGPEAPRPLERSGPRYEDSRGRAVLLFVPS